MNKVHCKENKKEKLRPTCTNYCLSSSLLVWKGLTSEYGQLGEIDFQDRFIKFHSLYHLRILCEYSSKPYQKFSSAQKYNPEH